MTRPICTAGDSWRYHHCGGSETVSEYAYFQTSSEFSFLVTFSLPSSSMLSTLPTIIGDLNVTIRHFLASKYLVLGEGSESLAGVLKSLDLERSNKNLPTEKKDITINNNTAS